jgi:Ni/Co efflux regulator RcnB
LVLVTTATTLSLVALTMTSVQEASAAKQCNNNDDTSNQDKDDNGRTCADQQPQEHSKNRDPSSTSDTKNSIPFRLPMPFP